MAEDNICSICHDSLEGAVQIGCSHWYHPGCIYIWLLRSNSCPMRCTPGVSAEIMKSLKEKLTPTDHWNKLQSDKHLLLIEGVHILTSLLDVECILPHIQPRVTHEEAKRYGKVAALLPAIAFTGLTAHCMVTNPHTKEITRLYFLLHDVQFFVNSESPFITKTRDEQSLQIVLRDCHAEALEALSKSLSAKSKTSSQLKIARRESARISVCAYLNSGATVHDRQTDTISSTCSGGGVGTFQLTMSIREYTFDGVKKCFTHLECLRASVTQYEPRVSIDTLISRMETAELS